MLVVECVGRGRQQLVEVAIERLWPTKHQLVGAVQVGPDKKERQAGWDRGHMAPDADMRDDEGQRESCDLAKFDRVDVALPS